MYLFQVIEKDSDDYQYFLGGSFAEVEEFYESTDDIWSIALIDSVPKEFREGKQVYEVYKYDGDDGHLFYTLANSYAEVEERFNNPSGIKCLGEVNE